MKNILIVDDEINIRELLYQSLEDIEDYDVKLSMVSNGKDALEYIYNNNIPDIIFLDIMLPDINGYDVCRELKSNYKFKDIFIIMITAKGQTFDKSKGIESGADMYITKPFDPEFILDKVYEILKL